MSNDQILLDQLKRMEYKLERIERDAHKMSKHVDFIERVYCSVRDSASRVLKFFTVLGVAAADLPAIDLNTIDTADDDEHGTIANDADVLD